MFLPVSLRAMVLLPPPDRKDFAAEARVMTKVQNLATGLKGHEGLHTRVADAWDLSSLDSLLSSQLVQLNLDPYNDVMDDIGVSASIGEDAAVLLCLKATPLTTVSSTKTRDLGGVNDELNDLSATSPVTSELPQKINSQNKARGEDAATETSSWAGVNRERTEKRK
ncbi:hypothetical protein C0Q70_13907 [Pomacea canaliculata]|uniref:Uncharacterized protein n=1 Tax=Pomacea canaliculata TaxID=400727 RepID=A0A2T7NYI1_POMCA|nr:hypothetical protein C0Q70_13907 [Pomacea canaliculata]